MKLIIRPTLFSGLPDLKLTLTGARATALVKELKKYDPAKLAKPRGWLGQLDYDGFDVVVNEPGLPRVMRVHSSRLGADSHDLEDQLRQMILKKLVNTRGARTARLVNQHIIDSIPLGTNLTHLVGPAPHHDASVLEPDRPFWQPTYWNGNERQSEFNCYGYAANIGDKTGIDFPQPGRGTGHMYSELNDGKEVLAGALSDGVALLGDGKTFQPTTTEGWVAVLVLWPGVDYHWYRVDFDSAADRIVSHKPGSTEARQIDNSGKFITDPTKADRGGYTVVVAVMEMRGRKSIDQIS